MRLKYFMTTIFATLSCMLFAQIHLKITYNQQAVCAYEITVKSNGMTIGKATSDDNGEVQFSGKGANAMVDVFGYKKTNNGEKNFDIQGYVKLDDNGFAHIKMEDLVKMMSEDAGFPANMMAAAWGLTDLDCGGAATTSTPTQQVEQVQEAAADDDQDSIGLPTEAESLALQEQGLKNEIAALEKKWSKKQDEIEKQKAVGVDHREIKIAQLESDEIKLKSDRKKVALEKNQAMQKGTISDADKKNFQNRMASLDAREEDVKAERKELEAEIKAEKKAAKEADPSDELRRKEAKLKVEIATTKTQIKLKETAVARAEKKAASDPQDLAQKQMELLELKIKLTELEVELDAIGQ
jgi:hypothetical protein